MKVVERICKHCGWVGAEEDTVGDRVLDPSWRDDPEYQDWGSCPKCRLGTVAAAVCESCGEAYPADDLHDGLCPECYVGRDKHQPEIDNGRKVVWDIIDTVKSWGMK